VNDKLLDAARAAIAAQTFSELLGCEVLRCVPGEVEMVLPITGQLRQQHGFVHGGVLSYLADNALTVAGGTVLGASVVTVEQKINYLRPAAGEGRLVAKATAVDSGSNQAVCRCDVFIEQGAQRRLCAAAQGTIRRFESRVPHPVPPTLDARSEGARPTQVEGGP
jgi:uncharacterized protein (TIGR00369 family)